MQVVPTIMGIGERDWDCNENNSQGNYDYEFGDEDDGNDFGNCYSDDEDFNENEAAEEDLFPTGRRRKLHYNYTEALEAERAWITQPELIVTQRGSKFWNIVCRVLNDRTSTNREME